jgi:hypothetical protein
MRLRQVSTGCRQADESGNQHADGQGTVEYAIVLAAFLSLVLALGVLWHFFDAGTPLQHALQSASHHLQTMAAGGLGDIFLY